MTLSPSLSFFTDYSMIAGTWLEPAIRPPSWSDSTVFCSLFVTVLCCFSTYYMYSWCYSVFFREYVSNSYHRIFCPFYTRFISCICKYSNRSRLFHTPSLKFLNTKITPISFISKHGFKIISYRLTCSYYIIYKHYSIFNLFLPDYG